jgi:hypothetical protein
MSISTLLIYGVNSAASFAGFIGFSHPFPRLGCASPGASTLVACSAGYAFRINEQAVIIDWQIYAH